MNNAWDVNPTVSDTGPGASVSSAMQERFFSDARAGEGIDWEALCLGDLQWPRNHDYDLTMMTRPSTEGRLSVLGSSKKGVSKGLSTFRRCRTV